MDKKLIKKAKNGNKDAFNQIIIEYQNDLYRIAKSRLNSDDDIYDVLQETIISAYNSIDKLRNISSFKSWLIKILINKCNNIYKEKQKRNSISYDEINAENYYSSYPNNIESNLEFNNLIKLLNSEEKTILTLYYIEGYKSNEISKILGIKSNTVRMKILRAKEKIKKEMEEYYCE